MEAHQTRKPQVLKGTCELKLKLIHKYLFKVPKYVPHDQQSKEAVPTLVTGLGHCTKAQITKTRLHRDRKEESVHDQEASWPVSINRNLET